MSGTGSNPAWVDGYIPPASEWNAWFGFKLDAASPLIDFAPFVSLTGTSQTGPVTGLLEVDADIKTTADLIVNGVIYINPTGLTQWSFSEQSTTGDHLQVHSTGHFEQWTVTSGHRYWYANNTQIMSLDASGDLYVAEAVTANQLILPANTGGSWTLYNDAADGTGNHIQAHAPNSYDVWLQASGSRAWVANTVNVLIVDVSGNLTVPGSLNGNSLIFTNGWTLFRNTTTGDYTNEYVSGTYDLLAASDHTRTWTTNGVGVMNLDAAGNLFTHGSITTNSSLHINTGASFFNDSFGNDIYQHADGSYDAWTRSGAGAGTRQWWSNSTAIMTLTAGGDLTVTGALHGTNVTAMAETIDELRALVQDLQTRLEALE